MTIQREAGVALWKEIAGVLASDIKRRAIPPGGQLPTEPVLAERFGVNRHTVRRAVESLQRDGLVRVEHGRGTFVREGAVDYILSRRTRFSENLDRQDRSTKKRLLRAFAVEARGEVARALELRPGAPVTVVEVLAESDGHVLAHALQHFPAKRFPDIAAVFEREHSITRTLAHYGVDDYTRKVTRITARMPEADVARALQQPRSRPVLQTAAVNVDASGRPVEFGITHFAGDLVQLVVEPE